jgi:hypothetical protein
MDRLHWVLLLGSAGIAVVLARALITGNIHAKFTTTYRTESPGTYWTLWVVLAVPLVVGMLVFLKIHPGVGRP